MKGNAFECSIICDDAPLPEYQEKSEGENGKSCFIASEAGKRFSVRFQSNHEHPGISWQLWIDGQRIELYYCSDNSSHTINLVKVAARQGRPLKFAVIELTDDDNALKKENLAGVKDIGTICLKACRATKISETGGDLKGTSSALQEKPVHEKAKKGGGHRVALGECVDMEPIKGINVKYIDPVDTPYFTFTWRYRPKDMLQAQGIIPLDASKRPATPSFGDSAGPSKRLRTSASASGPQASSSRVKLEDTVDVAALRARRDALEAQRAALDAQLREAEDGLVKREASPIVLGGGKGDVIDLTDD